MRVETRYLDINPRRFFVDLGRRMTRRPTTGRCERADRIVNLGPSYIKAEERDAFRENLVRAQLFELTQQFVGYGLTSDLPRRDIGWLKAQQQVAEAAFPQITDIDAQITRKERTVLSRCPRT